MIIQEKDAPWQYYVLAVIYNTKGQPDMFYICDENDGVNPQFEDAEYFKVVDDTIPDHWVTVHRSAGPPEWDKYDKEHTVGFIEKALDDDEEVLAMVRDEYKYYKGPPLISPYPGGALVPERLPNTNEQQK